MTLDIYTQREPVSSISVSVIIFFDILRFHLTALYFTDNKERVGKMYPIELFKGVKNPIEYIISI